MSEVIEEVAKTGPDRVAVLSGPNLAPEIADRQPAASVVACRDDAVARRIQTACHTAYFRPYTNTDVVGCELGGAVKNVIGLAVGIADGMGLGDNTKASLITRGLAETTRLGLAMGADAHTFAGLAGMGDLVATCSSPLSRNNTFGTNLGRGMTLQETIAVTKQTAEGVKSCESVLDLAPRARGRHAAPRARRGHRPGGQAAAGGPQGADGAQRQVRTALSAPLGTATPPTAAAALTQPLPAGTLNAI